MPSFNKVIMMGNLTRDPAMKHLPNNTPVTEFGLAINHKWKSKDGDAKEDVCFVDCSAFGKSAETLNQYLSKGKPILIEGRLKYDTWEKDGAKRSKHTVVVDNFQFVGGKDDEKGGKNAAPAPYGGGVDNPPPSGADIPF